MTSPISRRGVLGAPILLAVCRRRSEYFGNTRPPSRRVLKFVLGPEPDGLAARGNNRVGRAIPRDYDHGLLDPGLFWGGFDLGIRALDDVSLERPASLFLKVAGSMALAAVPRQAIEASRRHGKEAKWVEPANIVSSGAFRLTHWRRYERLVRGLPFNLIDCRVFKYASIDMHWRPQ